MLLKHKKKDNVSAYVHMRRDAHLSLSTAVRILDDPHPPPVAYVLNWWLLFNQKTYKDIRISYSMKYKYSKR